MSPLASLEAICAAAQLPYQPAWLVRFLRLAHLLAAGQARTNLVGDASESGLLAHVCEALTVAAVTQDVLGRTPKHAVDVGAGAGLEALTLAIAWPDAAVVAVESRKLRAAFIAETGAALGLNNLQVIARTLHSSELTQRFELASARAVWPFPEWPERARPILAPHGLAAVHAHGPAATLHQRLAAPGWQVAAARDVPGEKPYAVALLRAT